MGISDGSWPQLVTTSQVYCSKTFGSLDILNPLGKRSDGGPDEAWWYKNILNQTEDTSGVGGPKCGGKFPVTGRISLVSGAMDINNLKQILKKFLLRLHFLGIYIQYL